MKLTRRFVTLVLCLSLTPIFSIAVSAQVKNPDEALQRGYRTGYSDGYMAGYRDAIDNAARNVRGHNEYVEARRAYSKDYGKIDDYRDGYRQGFESGYGAGFEKRSFESTVPAGLARRGVADLTETAATPAAAMPATQPVAQQTIADVEQPLADPARAELKTTQKAVATEPVSVRQASYTSAEEPIIIIPKETELILEIEQPLSTERNVEGDKFTARVVSPVELEGAVIEGRVERITKPGRIKRRSEMLLAFDRIVLSDERWSNFSAILVEVVPVKGDNIRTVDTEGSAVGKRNIKDDAIKVGASTGAGAGIGALAGGPVGAAVGAGIGAAFGVGAVVIERGKHINLNQNQQLRVKTNYEVKIR